MQQYFKKDGQIISSLISDELEPIILTSDMFKKLKWHDECGGWGGSTGCDYVFSKQVDKIKLEIRTVDYDEFWHITNFQSWALKVKYLHELQFVWYLIFRTELEVW